MTHTGVAVQRRLSRSLHECCETRGVIHHAVQEPQQQGLPCGYKHYTSVIKTKEIFRAMGNRSVSRGEKRPGRGVDHPSLSISEVKEGVELYLYSSVPSWSVTVWTLLLTLLYELTVSYRESSSPGHHSATYYGSPCSNPGYHDVGFYSATFCTWCKLGTQSILEATSQEQGGSTVKKTNNNKQITK